MAPAYKLTYFDFTGLGESIRFLLSYGGIEFEDNRIKPENWAALKSSTPLRQLPLFEYNGKIGYQSLAICRYVAKQVNLVGKDDWEDLEIDATIDTITDLRIKIVEYSFEQDEKVKEAKGKTLFNEAIPFYLGKLDAQAKNSGYLVNNRLTWADVYFAAILEVFISFTKENLIDKYKNLQKVNENVLKIPNIKTWLEKRPKAK